MTAPATPGPFGFSTAAVAAFVERARSVGASDEVADAARRWAGAATVHPVYAEAEVIDVLDDAGFDVSLSTRTVEGALGSSAAGPTSARTATYLEVTATRR